MFSAVSTSVTSSSGEVESFVAGSPSVGTTSVEDALGVVVVVVGLSALCPLQWTNLLTSCCQSHRQL